MPLKLETRVDTVENQISYVDTNLKVLSEKNNSKIPFLKGEQMMYCKGRKAT